MYDTFKIRQELSDLSVLLVDDDESVRGRVCDILLLFFQIVLTAKNGEEALEIYQQKSPDIIITDLTMPKMDGFGLMKSVRAIIPKQKIIVMSAHAEANVIVESIRCGVDGYILKPLKTQQIFETIEKTVISLKMEKEIIAYQEALKSIINTQDKQLVQQLEYDLLTGLPNKEKLHSDFKTYNYNEIILLNIDNFSHINTAYGYEEGNILLKSIANFLQQMTNNYLYRGDGDEFFIALESSSPTESLKLAKEIQQKVYAKRFVTTSTSVRVTFSIGIVSTDGTYNEVPYAKAKLAISDKRRVHKNVIGHYNKDSQTESYQYKMHEWANKAKLALDFDLMVPYYQPIVNLATGKVEKYECLARIMEEGNPISPIYFIEPARIAGVVTDITRRIIDKSFETFSNTDKQFSINITDDDFKEEYLIDYLKEQCKKHTIKPSMVILEVLENISDYDAQHSLSQMDVLKNLGFKIAIDDFGAESSNFSRAQKMQADFIKIDGSFVKDIAINHNSMVIVKTIIYYAKSCGIPTVAEYVHDKETYNIIKKLGINYAQGFYISEPLRSIS